MGRAILALCVAYFLPVVVWRQRGVGAAYRCTADAVLFLSWPGKAGIILPTQCYEPFFRQFLDTLSTKRIVIAPYLLHRAGWIEFGCYSSRLLVFLSPHLRFITVNVPFQPHFYPPVSTPQFLALAYLTLID
ncbi:unnamed protein product, partial [Dicrocoelium dendriticum]